MIGYQRRVHVDATYASSTVVVEAPLAIPNRVKRMGMIRLHGSGASGRAWFNKDNYVGFSDALVRATGLPLFNPDLCYLDPLTRTDAGCGTTNGSTQVTDASVAGGDVGKVVSGAGIPANTTIVAVSPGVRFVLSKPATATATVTLTIGPDPVGPDSWGNASALAQLRGMFGVGGLLDQYGCRTDRAYFLGESQGGTVAAMYAANYPANVGGITCYASSFDLEAARYSPQQGANINRAWGQAAGSIAQVDSTGSVTGHPSSVDAAGKITPAWYYGTSLVYPAGLPNSGMFAQPLDPRQMDIIKTQVVGQGYPVHLYESTYDTVAGPTVRSSVPDPADPTRGVLAVGRIWATYVGGDWYDFSTVDDHPGSSVGDPIHDGANQVRDLPLGRIAAEILSVA